MSIVKENTNIYATITKVEAPCCLTIKDNAIKSYTTIWNNAEGNFPWTKIISGPSSLFTVLDDPKCTENTYEALYKIAGGECVDYTAYATNIGIKNPTGWAGPLNIKPMNAFEISKLLKFHHFTLTFNISDFF